MLVTDISRFYPSVYTHSIAWALHSKATAKVHKHNPALLGNQLDRLVRQAQDQQSVGIPIGPDTSQIIAEIVLGSVDDSLLLAFPGLRGFRYIDDYELAFRGPAQAEDALYHLQKLLQEFGLALNPSKTRILELPQPLEDSWVSELRPWLVRTGTRRQRNDLVAFFSRAFALSGAYPGEPVLRYAVSRMKSVDVEPANWPLFQALLMQCIPSEVGALPFIFAQLAKYYHNGLHPSSQLLESALNAHIERHSVMGHANEVAWAIWGLMSYGCKIHPEPTVALTGMDDSIVALLALDARQRGCFTQQPNVTNWEPYMTTADLLGEQWLLSYEANVKNWLPSLGGGDHVAIQPAFRLLKLAGVAFYDPTLVGPIAPPAAQSISGATFYATAL